MMTAHRLLAKSWDAPMPPPPHVFLLGHLRDVHHAAGQILDCTGDDQLRALGLAPEENRDRLRRCVLFAAALHDLGKANDHFQGMIRRLRDVRTNPQGLRHEWVSLLILQRLRDWLLPAMGGYEVDFAIVEWAVSGHHPGLDHESPPRSCPAGGSVNIAIHMGCPDFAATLDWLRETFHLGTVPPVTEVTRNLVGADDVYAELAAWAKTADRIWNTVRGKDARLVAAVKSILIAADIAGSALPKALPGDPKLWDWIPQSFADKPEEGDLQQIADCRLNGASPRAFQSAVAASDQSVTFVKAGCGTGKTVAAYLWAARNYPTRRLYFCYPTTGTATEGFKDHLFEPEPEGKLAGLGAKLFHSRRDIDFEIILNTGADVKGAEAILADHLESLEAWSTPIVACTVDTVLGLVQNNRRGLFAWPALAQSAFVFDEIHAYDDRLFGALLRFLRDLPGLPSLLMTASLPGAREEALRGLLNQHRDIDLVPIEGPRELEELPRYHKAAPASDTLPLVAGTLKSGGKVLWVCNTVGRAMDAAARSAGAGLSPLSYHSRFRYMDRVARHKAVIEAFRGAGAALAICTQVAEMSLDLSADLLVTDLAPVPALIQRLGRLNRRARPPERPSDPPPPTKPFIVIQPDGHLPYTPAALDASQHWLARLPASGLSQRHLAELWEQTGDQPPDLVASAWLDGGPRTTVCELREASPGITVLMREDLDKLANKGGVRSDLGKYTLPMPPPPRGQRWRDWPRHKGIPVAEPGTIHYDTMRGATWAK